MTTYLMKALLLIGVFLSLASLQAQEQQREVIDKVIAMVGGEFILLSELEDRYAQMAEQEATALPEGVRCNILDQVLVGKLLYNQSKLDSIEVSPEEVESQLNARIERILSYMNGNIQQFEEFYGQSITATKDQFRSDLQEQLAAERMRGQVIREVTVTPSEVKNFFGTIPADSLPYFNSEVEIGEIVVQPQANEVTRKATRDKLNAIRAQITAGEISFAEAARANSMDGSRNGGGDLGWAKRGKFVPEFEAAAYNIEPGEVSDLVETEFGYHLIQLEERRGNSIHVSHILLRPEVTEEDIEKARVELDSVRNVVANDSMSFSLAVKYHSYEKYPSYNNDGRMQNPNDGSNIFEVGDLDPDIYFTIDEMEVGDISEPMEFRSPSNDVMLRVVQLQSRSRPHQAGLDKDYSKIREATKQAKQSEYLGKWINETLSKTFIWIDQRYQSCPNLNVWLESSRTITEGNVTSVGGR